MREAGRSRRLAGARGLQRRIDDFAQFPQVTRPGIDLHEFAPRLEHPRELAMDRKAEHPGRRFGMLAHPERLADDGGDDEGHHRRAFPAQPGRNGQARADLVGPLGSSPHRAHQPAPRTSGEDYRQEDQREPQSPQHVIGEGGEMGQGSRIFRRVGQQQGHDHDREKAQESGNVNPDQAGTMAYKESLDGNGKTLSVYPGRGIRAPVSR